MSDTIACWTGIIGAVLLSLHIDASKYGYIYFIVSSGHWIEYGIKIRNKNVVIMNIVFSIINIIGIYRWIIMT